MAIELACGQQGQVHIVALGGRLDADGAVDLELGLQELEAQGARHFVIDAAGLIYASSSGLQALGGLAQRMAKARGSVRLASIPAKLQLVFGQGLPQQIPTYADRAAALAGHPAAAGVDAALLQAATRLVGADAEPAAVAGSASTELAQAAARLLDAKAAPGQPEVPRQPRAPTPLPPSREPERDPEPDAGLGGKLRRLLGPK